MKPPVFDYVRAENVDHALALLAEHGDEAKPVSGGQSLVPLLNLRLARPEVVVDVNDLPLATVKTVEGRLVTGALVRHRTLCLDDAVAAANPLLGKAARFIGHTGIRNRGTVGGSLAHADPAAELSLVALACGAEISIRSAQADRSVAARDFFAGPFMTALEAEELVVAVSWPEFDAGDRWGFCEIAERTGDFADAAAAVLIRPEAATVAVTGLPGSPLLLPATADWLESGAQEVPDLRAVVREEVGEHAARASVDTWLLRLVEEMVVDAFGQALSQEDAR